MADARRTRDLGRAALSLAVFITAACSTTPAYLGSPQEAGGVSRLTVGYRAGTALGDGEPTNDLPLPVGLFGRYDLDGPWAVGAGLDYGTGDFEEPAAILGLQQALSEGAIDSDATYLQVGGWVERDLVDDGKNRVYALAGAGIAFIDVDDVDGPLESGGQFDIETDADDEVFGMIGFGYQRRLGPAWAFESLIRYEHHVAEWDLRDRVSGRENTVDDYGMTVILVGLSWRF